MSMESQVLSRTAITVLVFYCYITGLFHKEEVGGGGGHIAIVALSLFIEELVPSQEC